MVDKPTDETDVGRRGFIVPDMKSWKKMIRIINVSFYRVN